MIFQVKRSPTHTVDGNETHMDVSLTLSSDLTTILLQSIGRHHGVAPYEMLGYNDPQTMVGYDDLYSSAMVGYSTKLHGFRPLKAVLRYPIIPQDEIPSFQGELTFSAFLSKSDGEKLAIFSPVCVLIEATLTVMRATAAGEIM